MRDIVVILHDCPRFSTVVSLICTKIFRDCILTVQLPHNLAAQYCRDLRHVMSVRTDHHQRQRNAATVYQRVPR